METATRQSIGRARGERHAGGVAWALGSVLGYASAAPFDRVAVRLANPLLGPFLRGLPSLLLGLILVWKNNTWDQMRPSSSRYAGRRAVLSFVAAGALSTLGLFAYYFALRFGGVTVATPVQETYVIWGTLIAWFFLRERFRGYVLVGVLLITLGLIALSLGEQRASGRAAASVPPHWYWAIPLALFTAFTYGISGVLWRDGQLRGAHQSTAILLQFISSVLVGLAGLAVSGRLGLLLSVPRDALLALVWSGVLSGIVAVYCLFTALRFLEVARVYAFTSLTPLVATLSAHFFLREYLDARILAGVVLVSVGVTLTQVFQRK